MRSGAIGLLAMLVGGGLVGAALEWRPAPQPRLDRVLARAVETGGQRVERVIIQPRSGQRTAVRDALAARGIAVHEEFDGLPALSASIPVADLPALASDPSVLTVSSDAPIRSFGGQGLLTRTLQAVTQSDGDENHLRNTLGLDDRDGTGQGIHVAIVDSGIALVPELLGLVRFYDFTDGKSPSLLSVGLPHDDYGHGTHVAGLIANSGWFSEGRYRGVAPGVRLLALKVLNERGEGYTSDVIRAIQFIVEHQAHLQVDVINLSLGHPILEPAASDPLVRAVEAAARAGIVVVASAGNFGKNRETGEVGYAGISSPGNAPSAITVGALETFHTDTAADDTVADFSSRGPTWYDAWAKPDVVAPGAMLVSSSSRFSALYRDNHSLRVREAPLNLAQYLELSGTSMAAAVTTGVVAVVLEAGERAFGAKLTPNAVKALLQFTTTPLDDLDALTQGAGRLNAEGAVAMAQRVDPTVRVDEWWLTRPTDLSSVVAGDRLSWSQHLLWGNRLAWGSRRVFHKDRAFAPRVRWGKHLVGGEPIVWSDFETDVVWDGRFVWGNRIVWGNHLVGFDTGEEIVWGDRIVWGTVNGDRIVWGNLGNDTATGMTSIQ